MLANSTWACPLKSRFVITVARVPLYHYWSLLLLSLFTKAEIIMTHNKVAWTFEKFSHMLSNRSVSIANFPKFSADTHYVWQNAKNGRPPLSDVHCTLHQWICNRRPSLWLQSHPAACRVQAWQCTDMPYQNSSDTLLHIICTTATAEPYLYC